MTKPYLLISESTFDIVRVSISFCQIQRPKLVSIEKNTQISIFYVKMISELKNEQTVI
jgi:hypothetical protein